MFCDFTIQTKTNTYITHNAKKTVFIKDSSVYSQKNE